MNLKLLSIKGRNDFVFLLVSEIVTYKRHTVTCYWFPLIILVYKIYSDQFKCKHFFWEAKTNKVQEVMKYFINFPLTKIKNLQYSICFISNKFWYLVQNLRCFGLYWKIYLIYIFVLVYHICVTSMHKAKIHENNLWILKSYHRIIYRNWSSSTNNPDLQAGICLGVKSVWFVETHFFEKISLSLGRCF